MTALLLQTTDLTASFGGRLLFQDLNLCLERERVALVGRNGVGKSTLLQLLSGRAKPTSGTVAHRGSTYLVPQILPAGSGSPGERRYLALQSARDSDSDLLLLDEPTQDLDRESVEWLCHWLSRFRGGALVATHDRRLLQEFQHFFVIAESGCRYLAGSFDELMADLEADQKRQETRYLSRLNQLAREQERSLHLARRKRRKKQYGRASELDRATPRSTLNSKRGDAQVSQGKFQRLRQARLKELRDWTKTARRTLKVELPLQLQMPELSQTPAGPSIVLQGVAAAVEGRTLFQDLTLSLLRHRLAVVGPNGAGKTTLLQLMLKERSPQRGQVSCDLSRIGFIAQGGANWMMEESLVTYLSDLISVDQIGARLVTFKFPLALAERPLRSLSPGERVRAALIGILSATPAVDMLVLDEPTYSLDLLGQQALAEALKVWPGGLVVASHQPDFLQSVGFDQTLCL